MRIAWVATYRLAMDTTVIAFVIPVSAGVTGVAGSISSLVRTAVALRIARMACAADEKAGARDASEIVAGLLELAGVCAGGPAARGGSGTR